MDDLKTHGFLGSVPSPTPKTGDLEWGQRRQIISPGDPDTRVHLRT